MQVVWQCIQDQTVREKKHIRVIKKFSNGLKTKKLVNKMIEQQISNDDYNEDGIVIIDNNTIKHMRMQ